MDTTRTFPVLWPSSREGQRRAHELGCPSWVPWAFMGECDDACLQNHDQTPERLAERGGLSPQEMLAVRAVHEAEAARRVLPRVDRLAYWRMDVGESVPKLKASLEAWTAAEKSRTPP